MDLSSNVVKIIGGVGAASVTAIAAGVGINQSNKNNQKQEATAEEKEIEVAKKFAENIKNSKPSQASWSEKGLLGFLDDHDIVFNLFRNDDSTKLTRDNFRLNPDGALTIKVKVEISDNSEQLKTSNSDRVAIKTLKELQGGNNWTWTCEIKFWGGPGAPEELADKDKLFNGFFDVLAKDLSKEKNEEERTKWRGDKKKFVENCSSISTASKTSSNLAIPRPTFYLKKGSDGKAIFLYNSFIGATNPQPWFGNVTVVSS